MPLKGLEGKRALVTGAASGIGSAVCARLRAEGVEVFATDIHEGGDVIVADVPKVVAANLTRAFLVCRELAPRTKAKKSGRIVGLTKMLALELGPFGITVTAIAPGYVRAMLCSDAERRGLVLRAEVLSAT